MTLGDLEAMLTNLNARADRLEKILPILATMDDLALSLANLEARLAAHLDQIYGRVESLQEDVKSVGAKIDSFTRL